MHGRKIKATQKCEIFYKNKCKTHPRVCGAFVDLLSIILQSHLYHYSSMKRVWHKSSEMDLT